MILKFLNSKIFFIIAIFFASFFMLSKTNNHYKFLSTKKSEAYSIRSDGTGYYAYLPQWFIYKTDNFEFIDMIHDKYPDARFRDGFSYDLEQQKFLNKYFIGTPILQTPSFLIAHSIATITHQPNDGYSEIYQLFVVLNAFLFTFLGMFMVFKTLGFFNLSRFAKLIPLLGLILGTNLSYLTVFFSSYSHVYSFAIISTFVYFLFKWRSKNNDLKYLPLLSILLGVIFLIRPTDTIIGILFPFFFASKAGAKDFFKALLSRKGIVQLFISIVLFLSLISLQLLSTHQQTGIWAFSNYTGEDFDYLSNPKIFNVLFSVRKGLFIYAPILLLSILGFIPMWKRDRFLTIGILFFLFVFTYITASWWCWWYGGGLGMRPYINILILFAIPFGILIDAVKNYLKIILVFVSIGCIYLYQIYEIQMEKNILHYDNMNVEQFKRVFLQTGNRFNWVLHVKYDELPEQKPDLIKQEVIINKDVEIYRIDEVDSLLNIPIAIDTNYKQWAGTIEGEIKLVSENDNPYFDVQYFNNEEVVYQEQFYVGGEFPKINVFYPLQINFNPKEKGLKTTMFDRVRIVLSAKELYFNHPTFQSYYYTSEEE